MTSRSAREFRRNNPVLFTDSENSENSDENESENDENESENEAKNPQLKKLPRNFHRKFQITLAKEFLEKAQNNPQIIVGDENGPPAKKVKKNRGFCKFCPKRKSLCTKVCQICGIYICGKHTHELCPKCFSESSPK